MSKLLIIDADTILHASSAQQQTNKCLATNIEYGSQRLFESKTAFNDWVKENNRDKANYSCETISELKPEAEPRFAFQSIKQKVENIVEASGCSDYVVCVEGEGNFRKDFNAKFVDYKGQRTAKPLLFEECREYFMKKYKDRILYGVGKETDDVVNILSWKSYKTALKARSQDAATHVLAYVDKDLTANSRGWLLNYNKLEDGLFWNDSFVQSKNFAVQMLQGDSADNIPGIGRLSDITKERFNVRVNGVGKATAEKVLADCKTEKELAMRVYECYSATWEDDWHDRMYEMGFFLYLLRSEKDKWDLDKYLKTGLK